MTKLAKLYYSTLKGEKKINCYTIHISKEVVDKAKLEDKQVKITSKDNKIIIEELKTDNVMEV